MAKGITISLAGMEGLKKAIKNKEKALIDGFDAKLTVTTLDINAAQKRDIPKDTGTAARSLGFDVSKPLNKSNFSAGPGSSYTPYLEFGTGGLVEIPSGLEDVAIQFKGKGIRKVNMRARPFFFNNFYKQIPILKKRLEKLLSK